MSGKITLMLSFSPSVLRKYHFQGANYFTIKVVALLFIIYLNPEADSGLVKLVVMTNVFFNNQQHKIEIKRFMCVKQIKSIVSSVAAEINSSIHCICQT